MINIESRQTYRGGGGYGISVSHPNPLASPFAPLDSNAEASVYTDTGEEAASRYRRWLWRQIKQGRSSAAFRELERLTMRARRTDVVLLYAGDEMSACCRVLRNCLEWMIGEERRGWSEWARAALARGAVIIDTETTGKDGEDEIVEIAGIDSRTGEVLIDTMIRPTRPINERASAVNGITDRDVADAPLWADVEARLRAALEGREVLAYHADFDARLLAQTCRAHAAPPLRVGSWGCIMRAYQGYAAHPRYPSLARACAELNIRQEGAHRAAADARTAFGVLEHIAANRPAPLADSQARAGADAAPASDFHPAHVSGDSPAATGSASLCVM